MGKLLNFFVTKKNSHGSWLLSSVIHMTYCLFQIWTIFFNISFLKEAFSDYYFKLQIPIIPIFLHCFFIVLYHNLTCCIFCLFIVLISPLISVMEQRDFCNFVYCYILGKIKSSLAHSEWASEFYHHYYSYKSSL